MTRGGVVGRRGDTRAACDAHVARATPFLYRGGTPHFDFVCRGVTDGLREVMRDFPVPVGFGVLTTDDVEQALDRSGGSDGNKGAEAARVAIEMAKLLPALSKSLHPESS